MKRNESGFTLIEMLAVVAIIGTIAVALIAGYKNVIPHVSATTADVMEGKLNNAANEWMTLKIQSGEPKTRLTDLGTTLEEAVDSLKSPIEIDGTKISVGLPKNISVKKLKALGIGYDSGEFSVSR